MAGKGDHKDSAKSLVTMGKKGSSPSSSSSLQSLSKTISKDNRHHDQKKQFSGLFKVLRPKVYIIDSSNFKKLVQELTGNGNCTNYPFEPSFSPCSLPPPPHPAGPVFPPAVPHVMMNMVSSAFVQPVMNYIQDDAEDDHLHQYSGNSPDEMPSVERLVADYSFGFCNQISQPEDSYLQTCIGGGSTTFDVSPIHDEGGGGGGGGEDLLPYRHLESWLLDNDHQGVSIYDYELSGLIF